MSALVLDKDRRGVLADTLALCCNLARVRSFDLDVAAEELFHVAPRWYGEKKTREGLEWSDGLEQPWRCRVWCNPPFSNIRPWVEKAWASYIGCEVIAMLLPATRTDQTWWQVLVEPHARHHPHFRVHNLPGRIKFGKPEDPLGLKQGEPRGGCVLLVWERP